MPTFWVRSPSGDSSVTCGIDEIVAGRADTSDVRIDDPRVSRAHFAVRRLAGAWFVRDLGSGNGTYVNGARIHAEAPLHDRDIIAAGGSSIVVGLPPERGASTVLEQISAPPPLTPREQEVLAALCEPLLAGDPYAEAASVRSIAETLTVTPDAVKKVLARLYDKFDVAEGSGTRRLNLARKAILSQAVRPAP